MQATIEQNQKDIASYSQQLEPSDLKKDAVIPQSTKDTELSPIKNYKALNSLPPATESQKENSEPSGGFWSRMKAALYSWAPIMHSRESVYRIALDIVSYDFPTILAAAFRNFESFVEALYEGGVGALMVIFAPKLTEIVASVVGKRSLSEEEQKHTRKYLKFHMTELDDKATFEKGKDRIAVEEINDIKHISNLYKSIGKNKAAEEYDKTADELKKFTKGLEHSDSLREKIRKLKQDVMIAECAIEGLVWGSMGPVLRLIRKYILKKDRFTGTLKYLSDKDSKKLGEGKKESLFKRVISTLLPIVTGPILCKSLFALTSNPETVKKNSFLQLIKKEVDMSHGLFPKIGFLLTMVNIPKWTGMFINAQGKYELVERIIKFCTMIASIYAGDTITNGFSARKEDAKLAKEFGVKPGILVEPKHLKSSFPYQASFDHILERLKTEVNPDLIKKAKDLYSKVLYKGFAWHAIMLFAVIMANQWLTKLRVLFDLGSAKGKKK